MEQSGARNANLHYLCYVHVHISGMLKVALWLHSGLTFIFLKPRWVGGKIVGEAAVTMNPNYNHVIQDKDFKR